MDDLNELIEEIRSRSLDRDFEIPVSDVLEVLGMRMEEYLRFRYNRRYGSSFGDIPDRFGRDSMPELMELLELRFPDVVQRMEASGLHFSSEKLIHFQEFFVSVLLNRLQSHQEDRELLDTALAACQNPEDGYMFYMDASFDRDQLIDYTARLFLEHQGIEDYPYSKNLLIDYLKRCFLSGQLDWEALLKSSFDSLFPGRKVFRAVMDLAPEIQAALKEMDLDYVPEREDLKKQFRALMLKYHPDHNPEGLEKARRLNESYSVLLAGLY